MMDGDSDGDGDKSDDGYKEGDGDVDSDGDIGDDGGDSDSDKGYDSDKGDNGDRDSNTPCYSMRFSGLITYLSVLSSGLFLPSTPPIVHKYRVHVLHQCTSYVDNNNNNNNNK